METGSKMHWDCYTLKFVIFVDEVENSFVLDKEEKNERFLSNIIWCKNTYIQNKMYTLMTIGYITFTTGIIIPTNVTEKVNVINLQ